MLCSCIWLLYEVVVRKGRQFRQAFGRRFKIDFDMTHDHRPPLTMHPEFAIAKPRQIVGITGFGFLLIVSGQKLPIGSGPDADLNKIGKVSGGKEAGHSEGGFGCGLIICIGSHRSVDEKGWS